MSNAALAAGAAPARQLESAGTWVDIGPASPLFAYEPQRNAPEAGWWQDQTGGSSCSPTANSPYAVGVEALYFSDITFFWTASADCTVSVGFDGQLQSGPASTGAVTLNAQPGVHALRLEAVSSGGGGKSTFQFLGIKVNTAGGPAGSSVGANTTIDDADPLVQYSGFSSTPAPQAQITDLQNGQFYMNTVSYSSSAQASASLTFMGTAIYVFGPTGPSFSGFQATLDSEPLSSIFNASTTVPTSNTLLFYTAQLDPRQQHQLVLTNQVEGATLAIDYFVIQSGAQGAGAGGAGPNQPFWPGGDERAARGNDSSGALVGGILGGLAAALLLFLLLMYWRWKRAGGKGNFWVAFCGPVRKALKVEAKEENKFRPWPMMFYRPKYAVDD